MGGRVAGAGYVWHQNSQYVVLRLGAGGRGLSLLAMGSAGRQREASLRGDPPAGPQARSARSADVLGTSARQLWDKSLEVAIGLQHGLEVSRGVDPPVPAELAPQTLGVFGG